MEIIEISVFTRSVKKLLSDDEYKELQLELVINPLAGAQIPRGGGLRKLRWHREARGKSGGVRLIYYYVASDSQIYMLVIYAKGRKDDLTPGELVTLRKLVQEELA